MLVALYFGFNLLSSHIFKYTSANFLSATSAILTLPGISNQCTFQDNFAIFDGRMNKIDVSDKQRLYNAFPEELHNDVGKVIEILPWSNHQLFWHNQTQTIENLIHPDEIAIILDGNPVIIPLRVYFNEPFYSNDDLLTDVQKSILNCIYLIHCDGFVRQKRLELIIDKRDYFIAPYLFCLLGEYVIEILEVLERHISSETISNYVKFIRENKRFWRKTESRVGSYWNEYYRTKFPKFNAYVGGRIVTKLKIEESKTPQ